MNTSGHSINNNIYRIDSNRLPLLLWAGIFLAYLPHVGHQPAAINVFCLFILGWRLSAILLNCDLPPRLLVYSASIMICIFITVADPDSLSKNTGVAILCLALMICQLYQDELSDVLTISGLAFFVATMALTNSQSLMTVFIVLFSISILLTALIQCYSGNENARKNIALTIRLLVVSIPLALLILMILPNKAGPLLLLPFEGSTGNTGLSDTMSPGNLMQLNKDNEVAFRVKFNDSPDDLSKLYWRGPVLTDYNGQTWSNRKTQSMMAGDIEARKITAQSPNVAQHVDQGETQHENNYQNQHENINERRAKQFYDYTVTLNANSRQWLFTLDGHSQVNQDVQISDEKELFVNKRITGNITYSVKKQNRNSRVNTEPVYVHRYLRLPNNYGHKTRNLITSFKQELAFEAGSNNQLMVNKVLQYFQDNAFYYTLTPKPIKYDPVEEFVFNTREGYCEHYASAFVFMMRAAGIPARVVTGFYGGEYNTLNDYYIVRNANAHAWAEVWLDEKGWSRVDPTTVIPDHRVRLQNEGQLQGSVKINKNWLMSMLDLTDYAWSGISAQISAVINKTINVLLGLVKSFWDIQLAVILLCAAILVFAFRHQFLNIQRFSIPAYYETSFCRKINKLGISKKPNETANGFAQRILQVRPDLASQIQVITGLYNKLRYAENYLHQDVAEFKRNIRKLKI